MGLKFIFFLPATLTMMSMPAARATCPDGRCGSPDSYCPPDSTVYCSLCSDPRLCTFSEEKARINLLGPFLFSQFNYTTGSDPSKTASVSVVAQTSRYGGKIYASGLQTEIEVSCNESVSSGVFNLLTKVERGEVVFFLTDILGQTVQYRYTKNDDHQKYQAITLAKKCCVISVIITPERYFIISIDCFKISIGFRPFESGKTPCIYVELQKDSVIQFEAQQPVPSQLCLADNFHIGELENLTGISSPSEALNYQAFTSNITTARFPLLPPNTAEFNTLLRGCPKNLLPPYMALSPLLHDFQMVECLSTSPGLESVVHLNILAVQIGCYNQTSKCREIEALITPCINVPSIRTLISYLWPFCGS